MAPAAEPLPELDKSDAPLLKALGDALGKRWLALILPGELISRIVATVDSLPRANLPASIVPLKRARGAFLVSGKNETLAIDPANAKRYAPYVRFARAIDANRLVAVYRTFYPLFQSAYVDLGYPKAYFNDRLIEAIDDLLAAPALAAPVRLAQPGVLYEFADPKLESRSAGQKIMMRIGRDNAETIKAKLREIRQLVARPTPATP